MRPVVPDGAPAKSSLLLAASQASDAVACSRDSLVAAHLLGRRSSAVMDLAAALVEIGDRLDLVYRSLGPLELVALRDDGPRFV